MTKEFQEELLRFLFQDPTAKRYRECLDVTLFDNPSWQVVYDLWDSYVEKFNSSPTKAAMIEWFSSELSKGKVAIEERVKQEILTTITSLFRPSIVSTDFVVHKIIEFAQKKGTRNLFSAYADKIPTADDGLFEKIHADMGKIVRLRHELEDKKDSGAGFLLQDMFSPRRKDVKGHPTFLTKVNNMTAAKGFHTPQLIIFLGGPKAFKTGILINILLEYVRSGLNVYYADAENGADSIRKRFTQAILECKKDEIGLYTKELKQILKRFKSFKSGDVHVEFYPAQVSTLDHVDADLERLKAEHNWVPDIIAYDYLDLFASTDKTIKDKRLIIQNVYHHAIRLNNKWNTFAFSISPVKSSAINKIDIKVTDFGEDQAKAYNCHASFAICRTEQEMAIHRARIVPVVQREGVPNRYNASTTCVLELDEENMSVKEDPNVEEYLETLRELEKGPVGRAKAARPTLVKIDKADIKDI